MKKTLLAALIIAMSVAWGCIKTNADYEPSAIEKKYGLTGAYVDDISTEDGTIKATVVPTTLDGRKVQLIIPHQHIDDEHQVFIRDGITITPLELSDNETTAPGLRAISTSSC